MKTQNIYNFIKVCELGSIHKAADVLNVTSQGLGKEIHALEVELGAPLLKRNVKGVYLTEFGAAVFSHMQAINNESNVVNRIAQKYQEKVSSFRVLLEDFEISNYIISGLSIYAKSIDIEIEPVIGHYSPEEAEELFLKENFLYRGCVHKQCKKTYDYPYEVIDEIVDYPVVNIKNPIAKKSSLQLSDFEGLTILSHTYNDFYPWVLKNYFATEGSHLVQPTFKEITGRDFCLREVQKHPEAVTFVSDSVKDALSENPNYKIFTDEDSLKYGRSNYIIQTKGNAVDQKLYEIVKSNTLINRTIKLFK